MKYLASVDVFAAACKAQACWGIYLHLGGEDSPLLDGTPESGAAFDAWAERQRTMVPWMDRADFALFLGDGGAHFFGTEAEIEAAYKATHGDDGPCLPDGSCRTRHVYAITCDDTGQLMTENT